MSQEPVLFNMSIADNIRFGRDGGEGVTMEEIQQAARAANVHDFIAGLRLVIEGSAEWWAETKSGNC